MNEWVGYITRSYESIRESIISRLPNKIPEITDYSLSEPFIKILTIWAGLMEMLGYYVDNAAREAFLNSARQYKSAVSIAKYFNYRIKAWKAATVELTFTLSSNPVSNFVIPIGTEVTRNDGVKYFTISSATITPAETSVNVQARQAIELQNQIIGISDGSENQVFTIDGQIVDKLISIVVDNVNYFFVEDLVLSESTDNHFTTNINEDGVFYVQFGDDSIGKIPPIGENILATYYITDAEIGNSAENTIVNTQISAPVGLQLNVTNLNRATGGGQKDTLQDLKRLIPITHRVQDKAVTAFDYSNLALQVAGVAQATHSYECGNNVIIYIAPDGGGLATNTLLTNVFNYFQSRKMVATNIVTKSAGFIAIKITANVLINSGSQNNTVKSDIENNLLNSIGVNSLKIKQPVYIGDIYQIIENTSNVISVVELNIATIPFIQRIIGSVDLQIDINILNKLQKTVKWRITFTSSTSFQIFQDNVYIQLGSIETLIELDGITINISDNNYIIGDTFEFVTYQNNVNIFPDEFSIVTAFAENIDITTNGGI